MSRGSRKRTGAVALLAVLCGVLAAMVWADSISANQRAERDDLELFLEASSAGWAEVTSQFFTVPENAAETIGALSEQMNSTDDRLVLLAETMRRQDNIDAAYIAYPDGTFYFVARSDEAATEGFRTRVITTENGQRKVELTWTDRALVTLRAAVDTEDTFDARERPWYTPIAEGAEQHWTAPYLFASSQTAGITHSSAVLDASGEVEAVVGVDIPLTEISEFLDELSPRENGVALVVDDNGAVLVESAMNVDPSDPAANPLRSGQSTELADLIDRLSHTTAETIQSRSADGRHTTIVRLSGADDEWYLAVIALDSDFLDDATASNAFEVFAIGLTVAMAVGSLGFALVSYLTTLEQQAEIDELTAVYNRRAVKRRLQSLLRRAKRPLHVAIIDLDDFKAINDVHGHAIGDAALVAVAQRLQDFASERSSNAGRLGGDEFIVFGEGDIADWATLNDRLSEPIVTRDLELRVTASIGIARSGPGDDRVIEDLFRAADRLLFDAKRLGGADYCLAEVPADSGASTRR